MNPIHSRRVRTRMGRLISATSELWRALPVARSPILKAWLKSAATAVIAGADGTILRVSRLSCELSGWEAHELVGLTLTEYLATVKPSDPQGRRLKEKETPLVRALSGNRVTAVEGTFSNRLGTFIPIVVNATPLIGPSGGVIGVRTALTDLRKFKALEHGLRELYEKHSQCIKRAGT